MSQASGHGERRGVAGAQPRGVAAGHKRAALGTGPRPGDELATGPFPGGLCWADDSSIWQANLDGTNIQDLLSAWEPTMGVAVDSSHVYWINRNTGAVRRANPDGSNLQDLVPGQFALATGGVAVDASHLYWTSYAGGPTAGTIRRANLDGSNPQAIVPGQAAPFGIAVDASHLYWTAIGEGVIYEANLDGTNPQAIISGQSGPWGVAVDASQLYWTNPVAGTIWAANLDGSSPHVLATGQDNPAGVAVGGIPGPSCTGPTPMAAATARSIAPTLTAPARVPSSPARTPRPGWRSAPPACTGPTPTAARSTRPTSTAATRMPSSPIRTPRSGWRSARSGLRLAVTPQRRKVCPLHRLVWRVHADHYQLGAPWLPIFTQRDVIPLGLLEFLASGWGAIAEPRRELPVWLGLRAGSHRGAVVAGTYGAATASCNGWSGAADMALSGRTARNSSSSRARWGRSTVPVLPGSRWCADAAARIGPRCSEAISRIEKGLS